MPEVNYKEARNAQQYAYQHLNCYFNKSSGMTTESAEKILNSQPVGTFLIRHSTSKMKSSYTYLVVSLKQKDQVEHHLFCVNFGGNISANLIKEPVDPRAFCVPGAEFIDLLENRKNIYSIPFLNQAALEKEQFQLEQQQADQNCFRR